EVDPKDIRIVKDVDGKPGFQVYLGNITTPYLIEYTTDLNDLLVEAKYENTAKVKSDNRDDFDLEASVSPIYGGEYTKKDASQNNANPRIVNWRVNINYAQSTVSNVSISDTPSANQLLLHDTIKLYDTEVTESGINKGKNQLTEGEDYTLEIIENEDGTETFTITFIEEIIDLAYVLEYDTRIMYKGDGYLENVVKFNGTQTEGKDTNNSIRKQIQLGNIGGGIDGEVGSLEVTKVDADDQKVLSGATFELFDTDGNFIRSYTTGEDGKVTFKNLLYGDYILKETNAPDGYVVGINDKKQVKVDAEVSKVTINNKKIIRAVELLKVDAETGDPLSGATFMLKKKTGGFVDILVTDNNGAIYKDGLEPGEYQFIELIAPEGYQKITEPIDFIIDEKQTVVRKVTAENLKLGSVELIKFNADDPAEFLANAEFKLLRDNGSIVHPILRTNEDGRIFVSDLQPGK